MYYLNKTKEELINELQESQQELISIMALSGNDISKYDITFLNKSLQKRITETHCSADGEYYSLLELNNNERDLFADSLHNSYNEFFRNPLTFAVLERIILPSLLLKKKPVKTRRFGYGRLHVPPDRKHTVRRCLLKNSEMATIKN